MPSINMKLEIVTIIACEVDIEVFTSDKMQVRHTHTHTQTHTRTQKERETNVAALPERGACAAVCSGPTARCPPRARLYVHVPVTSAAARSPSRGVFINGSRAARRASRTRPR